MKMLKSLIAMVLAPGRVEEAEMSVPEDVAEGHFAVLAIKGEERKRFIVELECLNDPHFLRLLEKAKEEFGFEHQGALVLPCRPQVLQKILDDRRLNRAK